MREKILEEYTNAYNLHILVEAAVIASFIIGPCSLPCLLMTWSRSEGKYVPIVGTLIFIILLVSRKKIRERMETKRVQLEDEYTRAAEAKLGDQQQ